MPNHACYSTCRQYIDEPFSSNVLLGARLVAPFWNDFDGRNQSVPAPANDTALGVQPQSVYYRLATAPTDPVHAQFALDVAANMPWEGSFTPSATLVATWYRLGSYLNGTNPLAT